MEKELYNATEKGNVEFLNKDLSHEYFLSQTSEKNNILHIAIRHEHYKFIEKALMSLSKLVPRLISEANSILDTPLHVAAEVGNLNIVRLLHECCSKEYWQVRNSKGNAPIHLALIHGNVEVAKFLVEKDPELASIFNDLKEAPLHLAIKHHVDVDDDSPIARFTDKNSTAKRKNPIDATSAVLPTKIASGKDLLSLVEILLQNNSHIACRRDVNGSTPLHLAASLNEAYNLRVIKVILNHCPQSAEVCDGSGKTILHLVVKRVTSYQVGKALLTIRGIYALRNCQDHDGNMPIHLAAMNKDMIMVRVLLESSPKLNTKNSDGVTATSLIQELGHEIFEVEGTRKLTREECRAAEEANVSFLRERLSTLGMDFLLSRDEFGQNVLHILMAISKKSCIIRDEFEDFIKDVLECFPFLIYQKDTLFSYTPIHCLANTSPLNVPSKLTEGRSDGTPVGPVHNVVQPDTAGSFAAREKLRDFLTNLLNICYQYVIKDQGRTNNSGLYHNPPWRMKCSKGNTPLHVALKADNEKVALKLLEFDPDVLEAEYANDNKETPLHLLCSYKIADDYSAYKYFHGILHAAIMKEDAEHLINSSRGDAASLHDMDGNTPLLRAVEHDNIKVFNLLLDRVTDLEQFCNRNGTSVWHLLAKPGKNLTNIDSFVKALDMRWLGSASLKDPNGRIFWHLLSYGEPKHSPSTEVCKSLCSGSSLNIGVLLDSKDNDGNTPLHLAIERSRFDVVQLLLDCARQFVWKSPEHLLGLPNNMGITPGDLIGSLPHVPQEFEKFIEKDKALRGLRSLWGVPTTEIKDYMNTIGVTAALLATITFTAAFTVPGGLNQENGTPLLMNRVAFQVFMISDILAMCLSMMVLFCLLWIFTTRSKGETVLLLDLSILFLQGSFYTTLLTFMTGLYVTTYSITPWIGVFTLALCSFLMVLMHKYFVMKLLIPLGRVLLVLYRKLSPYASSFMDWCGRIIYSCGKILLCVKLIRKVKKDRAQARFLESLSKGAENVPAVAN